MSEAQAVRPLGLDEVRSWLGNDADGFDGRQVGFAHAVFVDAVSGAPTWLVVRWKQRRLGATHVVVPATDCAAAGGRVWVAHGHDAIRSAPVVDPGRPLLREHELTICDHYGIAEAVGRAAEVAGRGEGEITSQPAR
ncbi:MAG: hypothetical protein ACM3N0_09010 [Chloroflexota bacterium]